MTYGLYIYILNLIILLKRSNIHLETNIQTIFLKAQMELQGDLAERGKKNPHKQHKEHQVAEVGSQDWLVPVVVCSGLSQLKRKIRCEDG